MKFWILLITIAVAFCGRCKNRFGTSTVAPPATTSLLTTTEYTPESQCSLQDMKSWNTPYANSSTVEYYNVPLEDHFKITNATTIQLEFGDQMDYIYVVKLACKVESRYNDSYTSLNISNSTFVYSPGALPPIMFFNVKCDNGKWICGGMESSWPTNYTTLLTITKAKIIPPTPTTEIPTTTATLGGCSLQDLKFREYQDKDVPLEDHIKFANSTTIGLSFNDTLDYEYVVLTSCRSPKPATVIRLNYIDASVNVLNTYYDIGCVDNKWICPKLTSNIYKATVEIFKFPRRSTTATPPTTAASTTSSTPGL